MVAGRPSTSSPSSDLPFHKDKMAINIITEAPRTSWALVGTAVLALMYTAYLYAFPKPIPGIPYNNASAHRILGDLPEFFELKRSGGRVRNFWSNLARKHDAAVTQFFMGPFAKPSVVIADFREAQDILLRRSKEFDRGLFNTTMWSGAIPHHFICLNTRDPGFLDAKRVQRDLMTPTVLHNVSQDMKVSNFVLNPSKVSMPASYDKTLAFIGLWRHKTQVANSRPFNAMHDLEALTSDIILASSIGIGNEESHIAKMRNLVESLEPADASTEREDSVYVFPSCEPDVLLRSVQILGQAIGEAAEAPSQKLYWFAARFRPSIRKAQQSRRMILQSYIDRATLRARSNTGSSSPRAAVDFMVSRELDAAQKSRRAPVFDSEHFHDMLFGYILGGQDTTHSVLSFLVKRLGLHTEVQANLRHQLRETHTLAAAERRMPSQEEIVASRIPYLDAFVEEVLRCNTPSPAVIKEASQDMMVLGHLIPKGTQMFFPLWGPSMDEPACAVDESKRSATSKQHGVTTPSDWTNSGFPPKEFEVERWLRKDVRTGDVIFDPQAGPALSFSAGNRECWGKRLAYLQLRLVTTLLVWSFEFLPLSEELNDNEVVDMLNAKPRSCLVRLKVL